MPWGTGSGAGAPPSSNGSVWTADRIAAARASSDLRARVWVADRSDDGPSDELVEQLLGCRSDALVEWTLDRWRYSLAPWRAHRVVEIAGRTLGERSPEDDPRWPIVLRFALHCAPEVAVALFRRAVREGGDICREVGLQGLALAGDTSDAELIERAFLGEDSASTDPFTRAGAYLSLFSLGKTEAVTRATVDGLRRGDATWIAHALSVIDVLGFDSSDVSAVEAALGGGPQQRRSDWRAFLPTEDEVARKRAGVVLSLVERRELSRMRGRSFELVVSLAETLLAAAKRAPLTNVAFRRLVDSSVAFAQAVVRPEVQLGTRREDRWSIVALLGLFVLRAVRGRTPATELRGATDVDAAQYLELLRVDEKWLEPSSLLLAPLDLPRASLEELAGSRDAHVAHNARHVLALVHHGGDPERIALLRELAGVDRDHLLVIAHRSGAHLVEFLAGEVDARPDGVVAGELCAAAAISATESAVQHLERRFDLLVELESGMPLLDAVVASGSPDLARRTVEAIGAGRLGVPPGEELALLEGHLVERLRTLEAIHGTPVPSDQLADAAIAAGERGAGWLSADVELNG